MRIKIAFFLLLLLALPALAGAEDVTTFINGIQARYGKAKDLTLDFDQVSIMKQMGNREQKAAGTIVFARPNKMRWTYKTAPAKEIITDGNSLVIYYIDEKKAYLTKAGSNFNIGLPMAILAGDVDVKTQYTPELLADEGGRARLKLVPKKPMGIEYLLLHINRDGNYVERIDTVDAYNNTTKITLKNPRFNSNVPAGSFTFTPKPGIEIIDAPITDSK